MQVWVPAKISSQPWSKSTRVWHGVASYTEQVGCGFLKLGQHQLQNIVQPLAIQRCERTVLHSILVVQNLSSFHLWRQVFKNSRLLSAWIPLCQKLFIAHCFPKLLLKAFSCWTTGVAGNRLNVLVKSQMLSMRDWWTKWFEHKSRLPKTKKNVGSRLRLVAVECCFADIFSVPLARTHTYLFESHCAQACLGRIEIVLIFYALSGLSNL